MVFLVLAGPVEQGFGPASHLVIGQPAPTRASLVLAHRDLGVISVAVGGDSQGYPCWNLLFPLAQDQHLLIGEGKSDLARTPVANDVRDAFDDEALALGSIHTHFFEVM